MEDFLEEESKGEQDHRSFIATTVYSSFTFTSHKVKYSTVSMADSENPTVEFPSLSESGWTSTGGIFRVADRFPTDVEELLMLNFKVFLK